MGEAWSHSRRDVNRDIDLVSKLQQQYVEDILHISLMPDQLAALSHTDPRRLSHRSPLQPSLASDCTTTVASWKTAPAQFHE